MKKNFSIVMLFLTFFICGTSVFAEGVTVAQTNAHHFGFLTLLPPLLAIIFAFKTKNVVLSLFTGVFSGAFLLQLNGNNIIMTIIKAFNMVVKELLGSLADPWNAGVILQCLTIGGLVALISKMGGAKAIAQTLAKKAKSPKSAQILTWLLGIFIFFDDYANSLIVGPIMRPVSDKMKISREKLSFIVDATAAPIAGIAVISTWIGYELSLIKSGYESIGQNVATYNIFLSTIPYRFYNILILIFIVMTAIFLREFGPMFKAERRARTTGKVLSENAKPMSSSDNETLEPEKGIKLSMWNAIIPILVLIVTAFIGFYFNGYSAVINGDNTTYINVLKSSPLSFDALRITFGESDASIVLFTAALFASIVAMIMGRVQKIFTLGEAIDIWVNGIKSLVITGVILLLAWSLSSLIKQLGTANYLVALVLSTAIPKFILPSIIFISSAIVSFATGTSFGTMGILMPLTIPLAFAISPVNSFVVVCISAVLTGAIFGDHCSPISDTTILSSMGTSCDHMEHVKTQLYYALVVAGVSILFGYIPAGFGMPIYIILPFDILMIILIVRFIGKPVEQGEI
ncbi:malate-2H(+)/Na(+)-lactate antiporter [Clostridium tepidiprofundi DSM 19306]|uniref:Malate-2H(+)/Na(+)-lactate antiporter n=1 Tax=Clostridium tepidiprofundi DSM 19306 TaxID=1121338 RepID=A0A151ANL4_9CLOT|nr:malate-2H(+)/Na(+)-lactate antiporter [Clostridium tepidiprofundi DSM 19306]